ncbi:MAG: hypothetical protein JEZ06_22345 [Anaerolineaceae bacterium]|nr:hypothetical protein [Anaerolineaceae bacterium]
MGGWGSGAYPRTGSSKGTAERSLPLDIRKLKRSVRLSPGQWFSWQWSRGDRIRASIGIRVRVDYLLLEYTHNKTDAVEQRITLTWTPCNYGGERVWFICPSCGKRVAVIYLGGKSFACRGCCNLTYQSCNETARDRKFSRADKLRERIGARPGCLNSLPIFKPKGMHQTTWTRIRLEIRQIEYQGLMAMCSMLGVERD